MLGINKFTQWDIFGKNRRISTLGPDDLLHFPVGCTAVQQLFCFLRWIFYSAKLEHLSSHAEAFFLEIQRSFFMAPQHPQHVPRLERRPDAVADGLRTVRDQDFDALAQFFGQYLKFFFEMERAFSAFDFCMITDGDVDKEMGGADGLLFRHDGSKQ